jgi:hypothetical protein
MPSVEATQQRQPANPGRVAGSSRIVAAVALLIALSGFLGHLHVARLLDRLHVFDQANVLFDADPDEVLDTLAAGGYTIDLGGRHGFIHPGIRIFLTAPIKVAAFVLSVGASEADAFMSWRRHLALSAAPASAGAFYLMLFVILRRLGGSAIDACLLTVFAGVSFSQLLFASVPESFPISNAALALAFLLFVSSPTRQGLWRPMAWVVVGVLAAGVTITNVVSVMILSWIDGMAAGRNLRQSAIRTCAVGVAAITLILSLNVLANMAVGIRRPPSKDAAFVTYYAELRPGAIIRKLATFPAVVVNALVPDMPRVVHDAYAREISARYPFRFTFDVDAEKGASTHPLAFRNLAGAVALSLLVFGTARMSRGTVLQRRTCLLASACLTVIAFNWLFHSLWGGDRFLYSQHWQAALMVLVGTLWVSAPVSRRRTLALASVTLAIAANNVRILSQVMDVLRGA